MNEETWHWFEWRDASEYRSPFLRGVRTTDGVRQAWSSAVVRERVMARDVVHTVFARGWTPERAALELGLPLGAVEESLRWAIRHADDIKADDDADRAALEEIHRNAGLPMPEWNPWQE
jgi:hypothetical protein